VGVTSNEGWLRFEPETSGTEDYSGLGREVGEGVGAGVCFGFGELILSTSMPLSRWEYLIS
jgi:hypothetical protein